MRKSSSLASPASSAVRQCSPICKRAQAQHHINGNLFAAAHLFQSVLCCRTAVIALHCCCRRLAIPARSLHMNARVCIDCAAAILGSFTHVSNKDDHDRKLGVVRTGNFIDKCAAQPCLSCCGVRVTLLSKCWPLNLTAVSAVLSVCLILQVPCTDRGRGRPDPDSAAGLREAQQRPPM